MLICGFAAQPSAGSEIPGFNMLVENSDVFMYPFVSHHFPVCVRLLRFAKGVFLKRKRSRIACRLPGDTTTTAAIQHNLSSSKSMVLHHPNMFISGEFAVEQLWPGGQHSGTAQRNSSGHRSLETKTGRACIHGVCWYVLP